MQVYKFGGASVKDAQGIRNITNIIGNKQDRLLLVVSAMGKMTNAFEQLIKTYFYGKDYREIYSEIEQYHLNIIEALGISAEKFEGQLSKLKEALLIQPSKNYDYEYDRLVCFGELFSTTILQTYFEAQNISSKFLDVRSMIKTDGNYRFARVDWEQTEDKVLNTFADEKADIFITQGFISSDNKGNNTTLGREGSDYSAAILAYILGAEELTIWKDVPGVLNADPKMFSQAELIPYLSYHEAIELAFFGAQVIHPKTIQPLKKKRIKLNVKSFIQPEQPGTLVSYHREKIQTPIVIMKEHQVLLSIKMRDFSFVDEPNISKIFGILSQYNAKVNMMQNSAVSFSVVIDYQEVYFKHLLNTLEEDFEVRYNQDLELITVRHYTSEKIQELLDKKTVLLEQKSRNTAQYLVEVSKN